MKNGIKTTATFKVDSVNKVVVCIMKADMQFHKLPLGYLCLDARTWNKKAPMVNAWGEFTVIAKARCNSTDTFDESLGKKIAESRAKAKVFRISARVYNCIKKDIKNKFDELRLKELACENEMEVEVKHINELVK